MSLATQLAALVSRIGTEIKGLIRPDHPGLARSWVSFGYGNSNVVIASGYNVARVTRTAKGRYRVTFAWPLADANYCWVALARSTSDSSTQRFLTVRATKDEKNASTLDLSVTTSGGSAADSSEINLVVYR